MYILHEKLWLKNCNIKKVEHFPITAFQSSSSTAAEAVQDAGADATADAADAGGYQGQHNAGKDDPHPPARPAFT